MASISSSGSSLATDARVLRQKKDINYCPPDDSDLAEERPRKQLRIRNESVMIRRMGPTMIPIRTVVILLLLRKASIVGNLIMTPF
jgi:hypothetical protein